MPRAIQITLPPQKTEQIVSEIKKVHGLIGLRVQHGISLHPPGDVISIEVVTRSMPFMIDLLANHDIGLGSDSSMTTSDPLCVISNANLSEIVNDTSESIWEEMEILIGKESNMSANALIVMAISGFLAVVGIATNALHIVIAGMVIAPGFEPISRISLGVASRSVFGCIKGGCSCKPLNLNRC